MMKRFASHYLLLPDIGFVKQLVVEVNDQGIVEDLFPLTEEIESVEWMPGVIALLPVEQIEEIKNTGMMVKNIPVFQFNLPIVCFQSSNCLKAKIEEIAERRIDLFPCLLYPFDFTSMQLVDGTQHKLLR